MHCPLSGGITQEGFIMVEIRLVTSKKGFPTISEGGGGATNTGESRIIAGKDGEKLSPIYIPRRGHLAGGEHAIFIATEGMLICDADHHRCDFTIKIYRIVKLKELGNPQAWPPAELDWWATLEKINEFSEGEWDHDPSPIDLQLSEVATDKATCYHCREPHYIAE
jgi:hypothetical protein